MRLKKTKQKLLATLNYIRLNELYRVATLPGILNKNLKQTWNFKQFLHVKQ